MAFDKFFDYETLTRERIDSMAKAIHAVSIEELRKLGEGLFPYTGQQWRDAFFNFLAENQSATYYHAVTHDGVNLLYCRSKDKGIWFLPGSELGPLQERGRTAMKELAEAHP